jgi:hypothetical protein
MPKCKLLVLLISFYLCLITFTKAHVVEQFYASYEQGSGVVVVNFDVAYAMPEVRDEPNAPQPLRDWLVAQSDDRHKSLLEEAERYLRSYIQFESNNEVLNFSIKFPDFKTTPYDFPKLLNAGAYYNIELIPEITPGKKISVLVKEGGFPNLLIANEVDGEYLFETIKPTELLELASLIAHAEVDGSKGEALEVSFSTWQLLVLGFRHVIPDGLDHVLFIIGMCLMANSFKRLLWQSLVFTLAHSLSMALVVSQVFPIYSYWVSGYIEAIIALSIAFIAVESLVMKNDFKWRCLAISLFGFVHGLGFAGSLGSTLQFISIDHWVVPLVLANLGIEVAQLLLVVGCFSFLLSMKKSQSSRLERGLRSWTALAIACTGLIWFIQRLP